MGPFPFSSHLSKMGKSSSKLTQAQIQERTESRIKSMLDHMKSNPPATSPTEDTSSERNSASEADSESGRRAVLVEPMMAIAADAELDLVYDDEIWHSPPVAPDIPRSNPLLQLGLRGATPALRWW